jgi:hypothetical protein
MLKGSISNSWCTGGWTSLRPLRSEVQKVTKRFDISGRPTPWDNSWSRNSLSFFCARRRSLCSVCSKQGWSHNYSDMSVLQRYWGESLILPLVFAVDEGCVGGHGA